jgi:hypothetical protein
MRRLGSTTTGDVDASGLLLRERTAIDHFTVSLDKTKAHHSAAWVEAQPGISPRTPANASNSRNYRLY